MMRGGWRRWNVCGEKEATGGARAGVLWDRQMELGGDTGWTAVGAVAPRCPPPLSHPLQPTNHGLFSTPNQLIFARGLCSTCRNPVTSGIR
jgi:hypothetical protein